MTSARVTVRVNPWERMVVDGKEHNHAFVMVPTLERFAEVCGTQAEYASLFVGRNKLLFEQIGVQGYPSDQDKP